MTRNSIIRWTLAPLLALALTEGRALAAAECCPVDDGAPTSAAKAPAGDALPPGHPPVSGMGAGATGMAGMKGDLPPGHPPVNQQQAAQPFLGSVMIRTQQGTQDGPVLADAAIKVVFHSRQGIIHQASATLNEVGRASLDDLRFDQPVQPVVTIEHGGATYQGVGHVMTPAQPDSIVRVTVYESQEQPVKYDVPMRHVMVHGVEGGVHVTEIVAVRNPTDRTWVGVPLKQAGEAEDQADREEVGGEKAHAAPKRSTVTLALPKGAEHVNLGQGFDVCCTLVEPTRIVVTTALLPGSHQFQYSYVLPFRGDEAALDLTSSQAVKQLSVFLPEGMPTVSVVGLNAGQVMDNGRQRVRAFNAAAVAADEAVSLTIGSPRTASAGQAASDVAAVEAGAGGSMKFVVALAMAGLVVAGLVVMFRPGASQPAAGR